MPTSEGFKTFIIGQLDQLPVVTSRHMFGGTGIYSEGLFFALIADDVLYFKVDDTNRPDFEAEGMEPFRPYNDERSMNYYQVPIDVVEDQEKLAEWARKALSIALGAAKKKRKKRP
jgi:DNA transformation protein